MKAKSPVKFNELTCLHNNMIPVLGFLLTFAYENNIPILFTSIIRRGDAGPHGDGRGLDLSVKQWPKRIQEKFLFEINKELGYLGAYSRSDNKQRVCIFHGEGANFHCHLQVKK
jgi:nicotinamidase-related amidase